jgi:hypothetical protein
MSSSDRLNPQQFMSAEELRQAEPNDFIPDLGETLEEMWDAKLAESKSDPMDGTGSLYDSIATEGVAEPVVLHGHWPVIIGGHHRIAAAFDIDPSMQVPVVWDE